MKRNFLNRIALGGLLAMFAASSFCGCSLYDKDNVCPSGISVTVRATISTDGITLPVGSEISEVALYVFDHDEKYLGRIETTVNTPTVIDYAGVDEFHFAALHVGTGERLKITAADGLAESFLTLSALTRAAQACHQPDDLFFGTASLVVNPKYVAQNIDLNMERIIGRMNVVVRGLNLLSADTADDFGFVIGETYSRMNFRGEFLSGRAFYELSPVIAGGVVYIENFNMLPSVPGEKMTLDILYKGNSLLDGKLIDKDKDGNDLKVEAGCNSTVEVDFGWGTGVVDVTVSAAQWNTRIIIDK